MKTNEKIELARQSGYNEACHIFEERVKELKKVLCPYANDKHAVEHVWINKQINKILHSPRKKAVYADYPASSDVSMVEGNTPKVVILDDNPVSLAGYAEEYPEEWKKICDAVDKASKEKK